MGKNEVYVTTDLQDERLWSDTLELTSPHWINQEPNPAANYTVRTRYRSELITVTAITKLENGNWSVQLKDEVRAVTPGQSAVLYQDDRVVGGGIVL
jgi:tRNA-specific 2-thiouridylase